MKSELIAARVVFLISDDPIPQPLDTTKRISYVDPRSKEDFDSNQNVVRYGLSDHNVALGIGKW